VFANLVRRTLYIKRLASLFISNWNSRQIKFGQDNDFF